MDKSKSIQGLSKEIRRIVERRGKMPTFRENIEYLHCKRCKQSTPVENQSQKDEFNRLHEGHNESLWDKFMRWIR